MTGDPVLAWLIDAATLQPDPEFSERVLAEVHAKGL